MRDARHDILFEPVPIGPVTLPNRFYQVPHCTGFGVTKPFTQAAHRGMKAEGGWGAVCTEYCSISPTSDDEPYVSSRLWDDDDVASLRLMTEAVHAHGALAGVELWHGGAMATMRESRLPTLAPSQIANEHLPWNVPQAMTCGRHPPRAGRVGGGGARAVEAGFDIVYVYGSHSLPADAVPLVAHNRRTDAYGGSFENRSRFWLEAIERVREAVCDRCAIAVRVAADSFAATGIEPRRAPRSCAPPTRWSTSGTPPIGADAGEFAPTPARRVLRAGLPAGADAVDARRDAKPMVGVGRYTDPDLMAAHVSSGAIDVIGAARPSIADPFLPAKIRDGRYDEIRECIGCNQCYSRANYARHLGCTQNATAGEEHRRGWHPERFEPAANAAKDVLVVGAGPAGLECAIVLAKRGFKRVHLVDAAPEIGGHLRWLPQLPGLGDWARVLDWRRIQLRKLRRSIEVITGEELTADDIRSYGAELVVVATGSTWAADGFNVYAGGPIAGRRSAHRDARARARRAARRRRGGARLRGLPGRRRLRRAGAAARPQGDVPLAVHRRRPAARRDAGGDGAAAAAGGGRTPDGAAAGEPGGARRGRDRAGHAAPLRRRAVPRAGRRIPGDVEGVYRVGDCVAPRILADAIFDGHRLAREIDQPDPAVALPWLRERVSAAVAGAPNTAPNARQKRARPHVPWQNVPSRLRRSDTPIPVHPTTPKIRARNVPRRGTTCAAQEQDTLRTRDSRNIRCQAANSWTGPSSGGRCVCQYVPNSDSVSTSGPGSDARQPPSTGTEAPVMNDASSERRKATAAAISDGWPQRFIICRP